MRQKLRLALIAGLCLLSVQVAFGPAFPPARVDFFSSTPVSVPLGLIGLDNQQLAPGQGTVCTIGNDQLLTALPAGNVVASLKNYWQKDRKLALCSLGDGLWLCTVLGDDGEPKGDLLFDRGYIAISEGMGVTLDYTNLPQNVSVVTQRNGQAAGFVMELPKTFQPVSITLKGTVTNATPFNNLDFKVSVKKGDAVELTRTGYTTWQQMCRGTTEAIEVGGFYTDPAHLKAAGIDKNASLDVQEFRNPKQLMTLISGARAFALCGLRPMQTLGPSGSGKSTLITPAKHLVSFDRGYIMEVEVVDPSWLKKQGAQFSKGDKVTVKQLGDNLWEVRSKDGKQVLNTRVPSHYTNY
jgi:hypothetical protein